MKNSLNKLNLWQKKRNELPMDDEPQNDWLTMQSLLDVHLPIAVVAIPKKIPVSSKAVKVIKALKAIKGSSLLFASLTAAACASLVIYAVHTKHKQHTKTEYKKHKITDRKDTLPNTIVIDSLELKDSIDNKRDSLSALRPSIVGKDTVISIPNQTLPASKNNINYKNTVVIINNSHQNAGIKNNANHQALSNPNHQKSAQGTTTINGPSKNNIPLLLPGTNSNSLLSILSGQNNSLATGGVIDPIKGPGNGSIISGTDNISKDHSQDIVQPSSGSSLNMGTAIMQNTTGGKRALEKANKQSASIFKGSTKIRKEKSVKGPKDLSYSDLDWGILAGVNSSGSFTQKSQNANIYGKSPVDIYLGLFATYHFNDKWAINSQIRVLNPQNLNSSFSHFVNENKADSGKVLAITDSRKAYFASIPIHLVYKLNNNISLKGGPVINIPIKQITNNTSLQPGLRLDSAYNIKVSNQLKAIKYDQKINLGLSGGVSLQYKRLIMEATYLKSFSGYNVVSDFGNYKSNKGSLQITLGLQLNRPKP